MIDNEKLQPVLYKHSDGSVTGGDRLYHINMKACFGDRYPNLSEVYVPSAPNISVKYDGEKVIRSAK